MKHCFLLLLATLLLVATACPAQTTFRLGVRGGANRTTTTVDAASNTPDGFDNLTASKAAIYAWQAGVVGELAFGKVALQPALVFSQKGERLHALRTSRDTGFPSYYEYTSTSRTNWLELPLHLVYTLRGTHGLQVLAGPYLALAVGGRERGTSVSYSLGVAGPLTYPLDHPLTYGPNTTNRRLDAGLNFGLGYRQGPVQVQLCYNLGLRNLHQANPLDYAAGGPTLHDFRADAARNRGLQLTGTYFFRL